MAANRAGHRGTNVHSVGEPVKRRDTLEQRSFGHDVDDDVVRDANLIQGLGYGGKKNGPRLPGRL